MNEQITFGAGCNHTVKPLNQSGFAFIAFCSYLAPNPRKITESVFIMINKSSQNEKFFT